ncbi:uncharacterized protein LAJ45_04874 [Morchella importuna]|uniref:uncharacterized protein n=1 Tax=Morchella importuna TaxID=1174673 RepID=UPI001E8E416E|nr:uncharacterized protein LAJ45_04874 [Morchella importuna]KAH8151172.1 hypothetical protein LAJ45_04874 [Morchella importuna]
MSIGIDNLPLPTPPPALIHSPTALALQPSSPPALQPRDNAGHTVSLVRNPSLAASASFCGVLPPRAGRGVRHAVCAAGPTQWLLRRVCADPTNAADSPSPDGNLLPRKQQTQSNTTSRITTIPSGDVRPSLQRSWHHKLSLGES